MKRALVLLSACLTLSVHGLAWRGIGPFRGGRTVAATGVPQQPNVFYIGVNNGGVWKTNDYGRIWRPIFDDEPTGSIGAIAVAPSDPNIIYVGSGEGLQRPDLSTGDGIYKSTDAGKTWTHLGLRDGQQIPMIAVDPSDPNRLFVAVLGHPYGANEERGIFRSTDGGKTFDKVLYRNENVGGVDVILDPSNAQTVYAVMWEQASSAEPGAASSSRPTAERRGNRSRTACRRARRASRASASATPPPNRSGCMRSSTRPRRRASIAPMTKARAGN